MMNLLYRKINGVLVWYMLVSHVVMILVGLAFAYNFMAGLILAAVCLIIGLVLAIKNG